MFINLFLFFYLTPQEFNYIEYVLRGNNMRIQDLSYEKKLVKKDPYRLKIIEKIMDNPLELPEYLKSFDSFLSKKELIKEMDIIFEWSAKELDVKLLSKKIKLKEYINKTEMGNNFIRERLNFALSCFELANFYFKKSKESLQEAELDTFFILLPLIFGDEDEKFDDTLKGILHRELGIETDTSFEFKIKKFLKISEKIHLPSLFYAGYLCIKGIEEILISIGKGLIQPFDFEKETQLGKIKFSAKPENNVYNEPYLLLVDFNGDDKYGLNSARGIGFKNFQNISFIIDTDGDDFYKTQKCFSLGAGVFGTGAIFDLRGNDLYEAGYYSLGAGVFGFGILLDGEGDDIRRGYFFSQGSGFFGIGILFDENGNDIYKIWDFGQGFGSTKGIGILYDRNGYDAYIASGKYIHHPLLPSDTRSFAQGFAIGHRPYVSGGIGILIDEKGNDSYYAEVYAQGTSYYYSLGALLDKDGNDTYTAVEYAQGAGIHLSSGILVDLNGQDNYISRFGPAQGEGHDLSVGILIDKKGDDTYKVSGGQGIGLTNSFGLLLDSDGNDIYFTYEKEIGQGSGTWARGFCGIGIFLDLKGRDFYPENYPSENFSFWTQGFYGAGYDIDSIRVVYPEEEGIEKQIPDTIKTKELFKIASEWEVGENKKKVKRAREMLATRKNEALSYIFKEKMNTVDGLELRAIKYVIEKNDSIAIPYLEKSIKSSNDTLRKNTYYLIGEAKLDTFLNHLIKAIEKEDSLRMKGYAIWALGKLRNKKATRYILPYLKSKDEIIRIKACEALAEIKDERAIPELIALLKDPLAVVRFSAQRALEQVGDSVVPFIIKNLENSSSDTSFQAHLLNMSEKFSKNKKIRKYLIDFLDSTSWLLRGLSAQALGKSEAKEIKEILLIKKATEEHPFVLKKLEFAIKELEK